MKLFNLIITTLCIYASLTVPPSRSEGIIESGLIIPENVKEKIEIVDDDIPEEGKGMSFTVTKNSLSEFDNGFELNNFKDSVTTGTNAPGLGLIGERTDTYFDEDNTLQEYSTENPGKKPASSKSSVNETQIIYLDDDKEVKHEAEILKDNLEKFEEFEESLLNSSNLSNTKEVVNNRLDEVNTELDVPEIHLAPPSIIDSDDFGVSDKVFTITESMPDKFSISLSPRTHSIPFETFDTEKDIEKAPLPETNGSSESTVSSITAILTNRSKENTATEFMPAEFSIISPETFDSKEGIEKFPLPESDDASESTEFSFTSMLTNRSKENIVTESMPGQFLITSPRTLSMPFETDDPVEGIENATLLETDNATLPETDNATISTEFSVPAFLSATSDKPRFTPTDYGIVKGVEDVPLLETVSITESNFPAFLYGASKESSSTSTDSSVVKSEKKVPTTKSKGAKYSISLSSRPISFAVEDMDSEKDIEGAPLPETEGVTESIASSLPAFLYDATPKESRFVPTELSLEKNADDFGTSKKDKKTDVASESTVSSSPAFPTNGSKDITTESRPAQFSISMTPRTLSMPFETIDSEESIEKAPLPVNGASESTESSSVLDFLTARSKNPRFMYITDFDGIKNDDVGESHWEFPTTESRPAKFSVSESPSPIYIAIKNLDSEGIKKAPLEDTDDDTKSTETSVSAFLTTRSNEPRIFSTNVSEVKSDGPVSKESVSVTSKTVETFENVSISAVETTLEKFTTDSNSNITSTDIYSHIVTEKIDIQTNNSSFTNGSFEENPSEDISLDSKKNESSTDIDFHEVNETLGNVNSTSQSSSAVCPIGYRCIPLGLNTNEVCLSFTNVYALAGSLSVFLIIAATIIYLKLRRRNHSSSLYDIPHLNIKSDYNLTPIPRPSITHPDREYAPSFSTETFKRARVEESALNKRHFNIPEEFMELKIPPPMSKMNTFGRSGSKKSDANSSCNEYYPLDTWKEQEPVRKLGAENAAFKKW